MGRRTLIWHIGLPHAPRSVVGAGLQAHSERLEALGRCVVASDAESAAATHELLRTHRAAGLGRSEVEGTWARICDRVWEHRGVSLLSTPELGGADKDQIRLALDPLIGVEVHLVVTLGSFSHQLYGAWLAELRTGRTTGWEKYAGRVLALGPDGSREHRQAEDFWAGHDLAALLARWGWTFHDDRLHVVLGNDLDRQWSELLRIAGLSAGDGLPAVVPAYADPAGVAVLRKVNRQLESRLRTGSADLLTAGDDDRSDLPVVDTAGLEPLVARWSEALSGAAYDVRGELADLIDRGPAVSLPGPREQLGVAVDALADALGENTRLREQVAGLEADRAKLDRKRRKLKRRLAAAADAG